MPLALFRGDWPWPILRGRRDASSGAASARVDIRAIVGGVSRNSTLWTLLAGCLVVAFVFRGPLLGQHGPVEESQCVRGDGAAVCVDRRGSDLEVRANGLQPGSDVKFDGDSLPVSSSGSFEGRWFFQTNEHTLRGAIFIEAKAASGTSLAGTVEFWERTE